MTWWKPADVGFATRGHLANLGYGAKLFMRLVGPGAQIMRRFGLVRDQIHFLGNYSLAIIGVSGLFVGFVLGLQMYYALQRYGSSEALGLLVALSLVRELGPVVAALLFTGRAGTSLTAEIGLMKADEQLSAMEMMAIDPVQRVLALEIGEQRTIDQLDHPQHGTIGRRHEAEARVEPVSRGIVHLGLEK